MVGGIGYDALDRLAGVVAGPAQGGNGSFAYDPLDNLRVLDQGSRQFRYHYDADNRLAQIKSPAGALLHSFGYDARGNTTSKDSGTLVFDLENRVTETRLPSYASYLYDGLGRRVRERSGNKSTYFYYSHAGSLLRTADYKTSVNTDHIYLAGSLVAARKVPQGGGVSEVTYQHTDALGTPVAFTDAAGNVTRRERMTAWGEPADGTWSNGPGYTGHQMDAASKLVYMQQRYYDPRVGRFLSVDPVPTKPNTGINFNRLWYANNNPIRFVDPDGRYVCEGEACDLTRAALEETRSALQNPENSADMNKALNDTLAFYGEEGVDNGVTVVAGSLKEGTLGTVSVYRDADAPGGMRNIVTVDIEQNNAMSKSANLRASIIAAATLVHEGVHGATQRATGYNLYIRSELNDDEIRAYTTEARFFQSIGVNPYGLLRADGSVNYEEVGRSADNSVKAACASGYCE